MLFLLLFLLPSVVIQHVGFNCMSSRPAVSSPASCFFPGFVPLPLLFLLLLVYAVCFLFGFFFFRRCKRKMHWRESRREGRGGLCRRRCCCINFHFILSEFASECSFKHLSLFFLAGSGEGRSFKERAGAAASALLRCLTPRSNARLHRGPASLASFHPSAGGAAETAEAAADLCLCLSPSFCLLTNLSSH